MHVDSVGIPVSNMDRALAFYTKILPFQIIDDKEVGGVEYEQLMRVDGLKTRIVRLRLGLEEIELMQTISKAGRPTPANTASNDHWFQHIAIIVSDMDRAFARLQKHKVRFASPAPQTLPEWNRSAGGIKAFYFKDPDGNHLETLQFPPDKGDERWRDHNGQLFLGIDHTAIVVHDTSAALNFYCEGLGLQLKGQSENYGLEQERLNNVAGAHLTITSVGGDHGPAIEFLEYLQPRTGRPMPQDTKANDLWHWQINLSVSPTCDLLRGSPTGEKKILANNRAAIMPPQEVIEMPKDFRFEKGIIVRDPTGHALLLFFDQAPSG